MAEPAGLESLDPMLSGEESVIALASVLQANLFSEFATDLNAAANLYEVMLPACVYFRQQTGYEQVGMIVNDAADEPRGLRDQPDRPGDVQDFDLAGTERLRVEVMENGESILAPPSDLRVLESLLGHSKARSAICVPLEGRHRRVGLLAVASISEELNLREALATVLNAASPLATAAERIVNYEKSRLQAITDPLTKLYNRGYFMETLNNELLKSRRLGYPTSLLMMDIDHFKRVNDTYGHPAGDQVLISLAECLRKTVRSSDVAARYGGEEFVVIMVGCPKANLMESGEKVRRAVEAQVMIEAAAPENSKVTISVGAASSEGGHWTFQDLLESADHALYAAKEGGRNRVVCAD